MELRVHGIGGPDPASVLGCAPDPTVVSWRSEADARSVVRSRVGHRDVLVYHWSPLTSGSRSFAVWPLLLPFTLVNVAGWMAPPGNGPWARHRRTLHWVGTVWVGLATTAAAVVWLFVAAMAVWQKVGGGSGNLVPGALSGTYFAAVAASAGAATVALVLMATYTATGFERFRPKDWPTKPSRRWKGPWGEGVSSRLDDPFFYDNELVHKVRWWVHVVVAGVTFALVVVIAIRSGTERSGHVIGRALVLVGVLQACGIAIMAVSACLPSEGHRQRLTRRFLGPATAVLGVVLLGGLALSALIAFTGIDEVTRGSVAVLYDAYGFAMLAAAGVAVLLLVVTMLTPVPAEKGPARALIPTLDARLRARLATALSNVDRVVCALAATFAVASAIAVVRYRWSKILDDSWRLTATAPVNVARSTFAFVLGFTVLNLVKSRASPDSLRRIGNVWDIITFWPRAFHPFAVRPYAERAVPELQEFLRTAPRDPDTGLVVAAHSQGTILMYAAVRPSVSDNAEPLPPFALVTFGSPLRALHNAVFPHYFDLDELQPTRDAIPGGWVNCFRFTDHIGRAIFVDDQVAADRYTPEGEAPEDEVADRPIADALPPDRTVNGHNDYWAEPAIRRAVAAAEDARVPECPR